LAQATPIQKRRPGSDVARRGGEDALVAAKSGASRFEINGMTISLSASSSREPVTVSVSGAQVAQDCAANFALPPFPFLA
jgi:hypothetical protein